MLQLYVTDDRGAVTFRVADTFPFIIGRSTQSDFCLPSAGIWEEHASIRLADDEQGRTRFVIESVGQSIVSINGEIAPSQTLVMGDVISVGAVRVMVSLSPARQSNLAWQESIVWAVLLLVVVAEALVVYFAK